MNTRLWKLAKKGDQFRDFTHKRAPKIYTLYANLWNQTYDCKKDAIFSWFLISYYFQLKKNSFVGSFAKSRMNYTLYGTYSNKSEQLAIRNI